MLKECKFTRILVIAGIIEKLSVLPTEGTYSSLTLKINHSGLCAIALFNFLLRWQFSSEWIIGKSPFNLYTALHRCGWEDLHQLLIRVRTLSTWRDASWVEGKRNKGHRAEPARSLDGTRLCGCFPVAGPALVSPELGIELSACSR